MALRNAGLDVLSVTETSPGARDAYILKQGRKDRKFFQQIWRINLLETSFGERKEQR